MYYQYHAHDTKKTRSSAVLKCSDLQLATHRTDPHQLINAEDEQEQRQDCEMPPLRQDVLSRRLPPCNSKVVPSYVEEAPIQCR